MKCSCGRYSFGILLGAIGVVCSLIFFILDSLTLGHLSCIEDPEIKSKIKSSAIKGLIISAAYLIISGVFIYAIIKRKHKLIDPWFIFCAAGLVGCFKVIIVKSIAIANGTETGSENVKRFVICSIIIVVDILVIWFSYTIYQKIRNENRGKLTNMPVGEESPTTEYTPVPDKS